MERCERLLARLAVSIHDMLENETVQRGKRNSREHVIRVDSERREGLSGDLQVCVVERAHLWAQLRTPLSLQCQLELEDWASGASSASCGRSRAKSSSRPLVAASEDRSIASRRALATVSWISPSREPKW